MVVGMVTGRVDNAYREGMVMFMVQIEKNAGNISRQLVLTITVLWSMWYLLQLLTKLNKIILFSDVFPVLETLRWLRLVIMENIVLKIPGQLYRPYYLCQENKGRTF